VINTYEMKRDSLIPKAEQYADIVAGPRPRATETRHQKDEELDKWNATWNKAFHSKMDELWEKKGKFLHIKTAITGLEPLPAENSIQ